MQLLHTLTQVLFKRLRTCTKSTKRAISRLPLQIQTDRCTSCCLDQASSTWSVLGGALCECMMLSKYASNMFRVQHQTQWSWHCRHLRTRLTPILLPRKSSSKDGMASSWTYGRHRMETGKLVARCSHCFDRTLYKTYGTHSCKFFLVLCCSDEGRKKGKHVITTTSFSRWMHV